ncbi:hypothetical protein PSN45_004482 [Yamadazyma tenuis]|uniref:RRM domain-containing protein n=1 Tax=Candida tenuis (strain ATCC 10573 / BCRC 21748 / CBS 615 / JCM 9827 / NBRC 10315 / NRRL Y-1498 / VKM Y-70) TaxID=590646 RepID=G3B5J9_CANTC|nr:uncharacterized protein CANTEDRAFT_106814 [Yamadazyma tenuis ATCC 10573]EGV63248.1 hypothetical protein CANTEDRAFT_106814 [Yamadazyma tenuis ATCC 10573]WEJ96936.1 hypothetical protein PSN45_004482 [Yamadazyma tenuis]
MDEFPPKPPAPGVILKDPLKLKDLDDRISFDNEKKQFIFTQVKGDKTFEYQYSFIVDKWIGITKHVLNQDELEEEANKEEIKQLKKQKISEIKQEKDKLKSMSSRSTGIFISNLPQSITVDELNEEFAKYGTISLDKGNSPRIKLYYDEKDKFKQEALIIYDNATSVDLAIQMMNQVKMKNNILNVEEAKFEPIEDKSQRADEIRSKFYSKVMVIENMFRKQEYKENTKLAEDIEEDIREECEKSGIKDILNVTFFPSDCVVTVKFKSSSSVDTIIESFDKRDYDGLKLNVHTFTGTRYT